MRRLFADTGISKLPRNDLIGMLRKDIGAVDVILGDKKFLFGVKPTTVCFAKQYVKFNQSFSTIVEKNQNLCI